MKPLRTVMIGFGLLWLGGREFLVAVSIVLLFAWVALRAAERGRTHLNTMEGL
jgi:hypothetical protein